MADYQMDYRAEGASVCEGLKVASWITLDFTLFILAVNAAAALCSLLVWAVDRDRQRDRVRRPPLTASVLRWLADVSLRVCRVVSCRALCRVCVLRVCRVVS
jgi:hypothetical protein